MVGVALAMYKTPTTPNRIITSLSFIHSIVIVDPTTIVVENVGYFILQVARIVRILVADAAADWVDVGAWFLFRHVQVANDHSQSKQPFVAILHLDLL